MAVAGGPDESTSPRFPALSSPVVGESSASPSSSSTSVSFPAPSPLSRWSSRLALELLRLLASASSLFRLDGIESLLDRSGLTFSCPSRGPALSGVRAPVGLGS